MRTFTVGMGGGRGGFREGKRYRGVCEGGLLLCGGCAMVAEIKVTRVPFLNVRKC